MLELLVDAVKDHALAAQVVNLLAQVLVRSDRLVKLDERAVQPVLEHLDLLTNRLILLHWRVVAAHVAALGQDALPHRFRAQVELLRAAAFELNRPSDLIG